MGKKFGRLRVPQSVKQLGGINKMWSQTDFEVVAQKPTIGIVAPKNGRSLS
jgi:hypothetical protein